MQLATLTYDHQTSWSQPFPTELDSAQTLVFAFGASQYLDQPEALAELSRAFPQSQMIGCSTSGEIVGTTISDNSLVVAIARFERTRLAIAGATIGCADDSAAAGRQLATQLDGPDLRAVFVLSDGLLVNGSELIQGLNDALTHPAHVSGGLAGDGARFQRTWVMRGGQLHSRYVAAVGLYGNHVIVGSGSQGGWDIFGRERLITRSQGNVLYELDGKPALHLYKEYLGDLAAELPATALLFPLAIRSNHPDQHSVIRTILSIDEGQQTMTFAGNIPQGARAQLMRASLDRLIDGAADAAALARRPEPHEGPTLCVAISCVGRRLVLRDRGEEEIEATLTGLPTNTTQIGFYSYGELSPSAGGECELHNQTMTLTTFAEA